MADIRWRYEPLRPSAFSVGEGPFRVRGLAYMSVLDYVKRRIPGGLAVIDRALAGDPFLPYLTQLFVPHADYDTSPLLRLFAVASNLEGVPISRFIQARSRGSAKADAEGLWKPLLSAKSLAQLIERTPIAFNRYYIPCHASVSDIANLSFRGELTLIPECMDGLYVASTNGFVGACLESAGARNVVFEWSRPSPAGQHAGVRVETLRFVASWVLSADQNRPSTPA